MSCEVVLLEAIAGIEAGMDPVLSMAIVDLRPEMPITPAIPAEHACPSGSASCQRGLRPIWAQGLANFLSQRTNGAY